MALPNNYSQNILNILIKIGKIDEYETDYIFTLSVIYLQQILDMIRIYPIEDI